MPLPKLQWSAFTEASFMGLSGIHWCSGGQSVHQGVAVTLIKCIEPFATRIKLKSMDQEVILTKSSDQEVVKIGDQAHLEEKFLIKPEIKPAFVGLF